MLVVFNIYRMECGGCICWTLTLNKIFTSYFISMWFIEIMREYPSIPIFLTIGLGFWIGKWRYKSFSLGTVTSVLLVGVLVGQMNIPISGPAKQIFFLLFLFAIGYNCGPQFAAALKGNGLKQVLFCVVICVLCFACTLVGAKLLGYNAGEASGLFAGAQTISAVIGVGTDAVNTLHISPEEKKSMIDIIPVCYAVTYVFGTIGSAWILGNLGPRMLGGIDKVKEMTRQAALKLNVSKTTDDPAYREANRPISFRAYKATADHFATPQTVAQIEQHFADLGRRLFVERVRQNGSIVDPTPDTVVKLNDEIVLSGRHEYIIGDESWVGPEVNDPQLLNFTAEVVPVMISKKTGNITVDELRAKKFMYGVTIKSISRQSIDIPVLAQTELLPGDTVTLVGLPQEVNLAAPNVGYVERPSNKTDMVFTGLAIALGAFIGALTINFGDVPVSLSTSGGALISGLFFGWFRTKHPTYGQIPKSALWIMNNLGLNMFIAIIGIQCGPTFISGIKTVGIMLFVMGIIATSLPLIIGVWIGDKVFHFPPYLNLGCNAGSRTTTASLGAIQDSLDSSLPAMGYTVTYAIGNTLLILMGVAMVLCFV